MFYRAHLNISYGDFFFGNNVAWNMCSMLWREFFPWNTMFILNYSFHIFSMLQSYIFFMFLFWCCNGASDGKVPIRHSGDRKPALYIIWVITVPCDRWTMSWSWEPCHEDGAWLPYGERRRRNQLHHQLQTSSMYLEFIYIFSLSKHAWTNTLSYIFIFRVS